jgi:hypothetical protein
LTEFLLPLISSESIGILEIHVLTHPPAPGECDAVRAPEGMPPSARAAHLPDAPQSRRFVDLARAMGIPAHDAARQVMELVESRAMLTPCGSSTSGW